VRRDEPLAPIVPEQADMHEPTAAPMPIAAE
jgi:hypothetical protein